MAIPLGTARRGRMTGPQQRLESTRNERNPVMPRLWMQVSLTVSRGIDLRNITWEELCDITWEAVTTPAGDDDICLRAIRQRKKRKRAGAPQVRKKDRLTRGKGDSLTRKWSAKRIAPTKETAPMKEAANGGRPTEW